MNLKELTTDKDGSISGLKKNAKYAVVEVTEHTKISVQEPAAFHNATRTVATIEEWVPTQSEPVATVAPTKVSAKPAQGE